MLVDIECQRSSSLFTFSFSWEAEGILGVLGASGAGKTTLINCIAGLLRPSKGKILYGETVFFDSTEKRFLPPEKRSIGYVFQDIRLFPHLSVYKNLVYGVQNKTKATQIEIESLVQLLGISSLLCRKPSTLSGGEKQRVAIGRVLLMQPRLILMDEPCASLDPEKKWELLSYIKDLSELFQIPIVYVSHSTEELQFLSNKLLRIRSRQVFENKVVPASSEEFRSWSLQHGEKE